MVRKILTLQERFDRAYQAVTECGCWLWLNHLNNRGYGQFMGESGKVELAHRVSYKMHVGEIPVGNVVMHTCDNPACVNPDHLETGTTTDNMRDMSRKGRAVGNIKTKGQDVHLSKLTEVEVLNIRQLFATGEYTHKMIADQYNLTKENIGCIVRRQTWKHI